jgi:hypothetical protein
VAHTAAKISIATAHYSPTASARYKTTGQFKLAAASRLA